MNIKKNTCSSCEFVSGNKTSTISVITLTLTLSCPGMGRAVVKIGHSNLWPGSKELTYEILQR